MTCIDRDGEVKIAGVSDFDLVRTFQCGQCFRWDANEYGVYTGVAKGRVARLRRVGDNILVSGTVEDFEAVWRDYFDLDRDYENIRKLLCIDDFMQNATAFGAGIRILRQDSWEALCSFIISQCNNIPRIKKIISTLCSEFGEKLQFEGGVYYAFPSPDRLAGLNAADINILRCGYRAEYIISAARAVAGGALDLDSLSRMTPDAARAELKKLRGVGDKVADCAILYGLNMLGAFPLDVWMKRAVAKYYGQNFDPDIFSPYAGIAQQYIYYYSRHRV